MKLYFIRHGQTNENKNGIMQGQIDGTLTELGKKQAEKSIEQLEAINLDIVYCSDLGRAKDTAEIINKKLNLEIIYDKRLRERYFGIYQNKHKSLFNVEKFISENDKRLEFFSVKKDNQIIERIFLFLNDLEKKEYKNVLIVTHGGIITQIKYMCDKNWKFQKTNNCEIYSVELETLLLK